MSTNIFIQVGDIPGESHDSRHRNEIEVMSWAWGLSNPAPVAGGNDSARAAFQNLMFTHRIDRASPGLMLACASGTHFEHARLTIRNMGTTTPQEFLLIEMADVLVTSVESSGTTEAGGLVEHVTLDFAQVDFEYKTQKPDGSFNDGVHFKWDLHTNGPL